MELISVRVAPSPVDAGRVRLTGAVSYDDRPGAVEEYWFDVASEHRDALSQTGNPWLLTLIPLAATLGEPLRLSLPVDRLLLRNVGELMAIWKSWYPAMCRVDVIAESVDGLPHARGSRTGSFFTGGVDSFFTALRSGEAGAIPADDLITVAGFDIPLNNLAAFERRKARIGAVAVQLGKAVVDVICNLRETRLETAGWGKLSHGCALAAVGLALEGRYRRLLIASTFDYGNLVPLGSHPLTDPLLSGDSTQVVHDGATHDRFAKLEYLSRFDLAMRNLQVCFRAGSDDNCGSCEKCVRTMATLEILGGLSPHGRFPKDRLEPARLARAYVARPNLEIYYRAIRAGAAARGRDDLVRAVDRALRRSRTIRSLMAVPDWMAKKRGLWRVTGPVRRALLAGEIV